MMKYLAFSCIFHFVLFTVFANFNSVDAKGCVLKYATDFPDKESVLLSDLNGNFALIEPENDGVYLNAGQSVFVFCPGGKNVIAEIGENLVQAKCVSGQTLNVDGNKYLLNQLGCNAKVTGEFQATNTSCVSRGVIKHIGHKFQDKFLRLIDICYDDAHGEAVFSDHILYGSAIRYGGSGGTRPAFKVGGVASGVNADNAYKQATQKITFTELLGSAELAEIYIHPNSFLARGHLSPDADFVYVSSQYSTYFYINTVPQWQAINNGNWKSMETAIRNLAANSQEDFQVLTGGHKTLQLENANGDLTDIYLSNKKLPVPKFVWKVIYSLSTRKAIAFVSVNNPFVGEITDDDYLCKDICDSYKWGTSNWNNPAKGLLYCCDVNDLRKTVMTIPDLHVTDIQEGTNAMLMETSGM